MNTKIELLELKSLEDMANALNKLPLSEAEAALSQMIENKSINSLLSWIADLTLLLQKLSHDELRNQILELSLSDEFFLKLFRNSSTVEGFVKSLHGLARNNILNTQFVENYIEKLNKSLYRLNLSKLQKQFMCNEYQQNGLFKVFPSMEKIIKSKENVIEKSRILAQSYRDPSSTFSYLLEDTLKEIAKHTRTTSEHEEEDAARLVEGHMNKLFQ